MVEIVSLGWNGLGGEIREVYFEDEKVVSVKVFEIRESVVCLSFWGKFWSFGVLLFILYCSVIFIFFVLVFWGNFMVCLIRRFNIFFNFSFENIGKMYIWKRVLGFYLFILIRWGFFSVRLFFLVKLRFVGGISEFAEDGVIIEVVD